MVMAETGLSKPPNAVSGRLRLLFPMGFSLAVSLVIMGQLVSNSQTIVDGDLPFSHFEHHIASSTNLVSSCRELWAAGSWYALLAVGWFSGVWPFIGLAGMLLCVYVVDRSLVKKELVVFYMTVLSGWMKWGMTYPFFIAFNLLMFSMNVPRYELSTDVTIPNLGPPMKVEVGDLRLDLAVQVCGGLIIFVFATLGTIVLGHWGASELAGEALRVSPPAKTVGIRGSQRRIMTGVAAVLAALLTVLGAFTPLIDITRGGFIGNLMLPPDEAQAGGGEPKPMTFSMLAMAYHMVQKNQMSSPGVVEFLALCVAALVFVAPLLEVAFLLASLVIHGYVRSCSWARQTVEIMHSFNCTTVFLNVSCAIAWNPAVFVRWYLGSECDIWSLIGKNDDLLKRLNMEFAASSSCYDVGATLRCGWYWLVLADLIIHGAWHFGCWGDALESELDKPASEREERLQARA